MPAGQIEIVEFRGKVTDIKREAVTTYLLAIDGELRTKYRKPKFEYLPKSWRENYQIDSFDVGRAASWKEFYEICRECLEKRNPFSSAKDISRAVENSSASVTSIAIDGAHDPAQIESEAGNERYIRESSSSAMDSSIQQLFELYLDDPPERQLSLQFEITGYLSLLKSQADRIETVDLTTAKAIAKNALKLLDHVATHDFDSDDYSMVQAAIRYFTVAEDATSDFERGGFDDDAEVLNFVARRLGREDLIIV